MCDKPKIDWTKPIETMSGNPAKVISRDYRTISNGICMMVQIEEPEYSHTASYTLQGNPAFAGPQLRNCKTKREGWVNVYLGGRVSDAHKTESIAKGTASNDVLATIKIEWEE